MPKRVKVSDLEVLDREWPLLVYVPTYGRGEKPPVLHISWRNGKFPPPRSRYYMVTNCGRAIRYTRTHSGDKAQLTKDLNEGEYTLCVRCGAEVTFYRALTFYLEAMVTLDEKRRQEKEEQDRQRKLAWEKKLARLAVFRLDLEVMLEESALVDGSRYTVEEFPDQDLFEVELTPTPGVTWRFRVTDITPDTPPEEDA